MMTLFPCDNFEKNNTQWNMRNRTDAEAEAPVLWPPDAWSWLIGKDPDAGKDWRRKRGQEGMIWLDGITDSIDMNLSKVREIMKYREDWHATVHGVTKSWTWLNNWTNSKKSFFFFFPKCGNISGKKMTVKVRPTQTLATNKSCLGSNCFVLTIYKWKNSSNASIPSF